jgi:hypothetical protein
VQLFCSNLNLRRRHESRCAFETEAKLTRALFARPQSDKSLGNRVQIRKKLTAEHGTLRHPSLCFLYGNCFAPNTNYAAVKKHQQADVARSREKLK